MKRIGDEMDLNPKEFKKSIENVFGWGSQRKLSKLLGRNESTVRRWIAGSRAIPPEMPLILALLNERRQLGLNSVNTSPIRIVAHFDFMAQL